MHKEKMMMPRTISERIPFPPFLSVPSILRCLLVNLVFLFHLALSMSLVVFAFWAWILEKRYIILTRLRLFFEASRKTEQARGKQEK
jgi:hypothetical protein